ncbi:MAG: secreted glycosyl hydrolase [Flavobacteriaceae bacterium]|nr:secreted glycosyl hydrolase [Flavobacteriaceae bacterium]
MKRNYLILFLTSLIFSCNTPTETISLFNGKSLDGWIIYGTEKWYVENGELICESGPDKDYGYLGTNKYFDDFILELDFKQEDNGNSGVFFRSTVDGVKVKGWQVEVAPPGYHSGGIYESYGRGWLIKPDQSKDSIVKMGEWNKMKIKVYGDEVTTWINENQMIKIKDSIIGLGKGGVALQIHDGGGIKVKWKNINLTKLN